MTGEPVEQATDKAWRRWIGVGLAWLLVEPLVNIVQVIAVRLPHLRQPPWQPAEPVVPDFLDVAPDDDVAPTASDAAAPACRPRF